MKKHNYIILLLAIFFISIFVTAIIPYTLTRSFGSVKFYKEEAYVGDTIGGTTAPVIGLISIFLLIITLYEQRKNNIDILRMTYRQHFKDVYMNLLNDYSLNRNNLTAIINKCFGYQSCSSYEVDDYYNFFTEITSQINLIFDCLNIKSFPDITDYSLIEKKYDCERQNDSLLAVDNVESIPNIDEQKRVKDINKQYNERIKIAYYYNYYDISEREYNYFKGNNSNISKQMLIVAKILLKKFPQLKAYIKQVKLISEYSRMSEDEYLSEYQPDIKSRKVFDYYHKLLDELITCKERLFLFYMSVTDLTFFNNLNHMRLFEKLNRKEIMYSELFKSYVNI